MQALLIDIEGWEIQMERLLKQIEAYKPCNEQEEKDRELWIVNESRDKVLMAYHNIYNSWAWLGGHADGEWNLQKVAIREVEEESGLSQVTLLQEAPVSLEILTVDGHWKRGMYVSSHLHLNVTYLMEADPRKPIRKKPDENSAVAWIPVEEIGEKSTEPWFVEHIYSKLCKKALTL